MWAPSAVDQEDGAAGVFWKAARRAWSRSPAVDSMGMSSSSRAKSVLGKQLTRRECVAGGGVWGETGSLFLQGA